MKILLSCVAFVLLVAPARANVTSTTTGTYDSTNNANTVDRNANGDALNATGSTDVAGFTSAVATAFANGTGGVIDFDSPNGGTAAVTAQTGSIVAKFGSASDKMLALAVTTGTTANTFDLRSSTAGIVTISGSFFLISNESASPRITLTPGAVTGTGASANERVTQVGFTLLDRNTITGTPTVTANFSDGTTGTLKSASFTAATPDEDTFYGFTAPAGAYITSVSVGFSASVPDARLTVDDFGFMTAVPEPSTLAGGGWLLALLAGGWCLRRRRV